MSVNHIYNFKKEVLNLLKKNGKIIAKNPGLIGKIPSDIIVAIRFVDGHIHVLFPKDKNLRDIMSNAIQRETKNLDIFESMVKGDINTIITPKTPGTLSDV